MSLLPYLAAIGSACLPLMLLIVSDGSAARKVVLLAPLLIAVSVVVFGFFWTSTNVADCTDCESSLTVFDVELFTTERTQGGFALGSTTGPALVLVLGAALSLVALLAGRSGDDVHRDGGNDT